MSVERLIRVLSVFTFSIPAVVFIGVTIALLFQSDWLGAMAVGFLAMICTTIALMIYDVMRD